MLGVLLALREGEPSTAAIGSLGSALARAARIARQRALVVIVSDFRGDDDWRRPLLDLAGRHDVLAVEIRDPREDSLPDVGDLWLVDPETGGRLRVDTRDARLRERFEAAAAADRASVARALASVGVRHIVLSTSGDWLRALASHLGRKRGRK
jgi:uncharacterized protein (DUF58 family)